MKPVDGELGLQATEALFLFSKSDEYQAGYRLGKTTGNEGRLKERETYAALRSLEFLDGFLAGKKVRKHGIKKGLRKAKR